jgi:FkbM family methyltransferase
MFSSIRFFSKRHPQLRSVFIPAWQRITLLLWAVRRTVFGRWPISFAAGNYTVRMIAKGQIAEYVWGADFEKSERNFAVQQIKPGMRVLNIGANAGLYTIIASKLVGAAGEVHSFEPSSNNFSLLKANIELNGCQNVVANNLAISNFQGQLALYCDPLHPEFDGHFFVKRLSEVSAGSSDPMEIIPCITVDEYWRETGGEDVKPVDLIIIDVEGAELSAFEGARKTIAASPRLAMIMECTEHVDEIGAFLRKFGFELYNLDLESCRLLPAEIGRGGFVALRGTKTTPIDLHL